MPREMTYVVKGALLLCITAIIISFVTKLKIEDPIARDEEFGCATESPATTISITNYKGEQLFKYNCSTCHNPIRDMTGPALSGVEERVRNRRLLHAWVRNNNAILKTGNKYFSELYNKWNKTPMILFPDITNAEIDSIMAYVNEYAEAVRTGRILLVQY